MSNWIFCRALLLCCATSSLAVAQAAKRVVISVADPAPQNQMRGFAGYQDPNSEPSKRAAIENKLVDALITQLATQPGLVLVDRQKVQDLLQEQNNKEDERYDAASGAKLGKLLGADVWIYVRVESYTAEATKKRTDKVLYAETSVLGDVRLTATAKALAVESASVVTAPSSSVEKQEVLQKTRELNNNPAAAYAQMQQPGAGDQPGLVRLIDTAVEETAKDLGAKLAGSLAAVAPKRATPKVVGIDSGKVMLNRGASAGIKSGDIFQIVRMADSGFKDPDTNQPIIRKKTVCTLTVSDVEDSIAMGICQGETPAAGDMAIAGASK